MYNNTGLIGKPLTHTLSPMIHGYLYWKYKINGGYCCFEVKEDELVSILKKFKKFKFRGFNITLPYKSDILTYLDEVSVEAQCINAVNSVKIDEEKAKGYNTDIYGIEKTFEHFNIDLHNKKILILGAGGSAKALFYFLKNKKLTFDIVNRTPKKAEKALYELDIQNCNIYDLLLLQKLNYYDIVINTTSVGINGGNFLDMSKIFCKEFAFDFQYNINDDTSFIKIYKNKVKHSCDGLLMLVYQAIKAFSIFHNKDISVKAKDIIEYLKNKKGE